MKRLLALLLAASLLACAVPAASAAEAAYTDVPAGGWAEPYINRARELGLMAGLGGGRFGYGGTVTNAQFAQMICNIMGWETVMPAQPAFSDVRPGSWYYGAVETAYANGVYSEAETFRPDAAITRRAMAEAFVRALGLSGAAELESGLPSLFADVNGDHGYINVAGTIGLLEGKSAGMFDPEATARREEAAALLVRFYEKYAAAPDFVHGFYAISSYSQRDLAARMDAVTYLWSEMRKDGSLDTAGGEYRVPDGYESIVGLLTEAGVRQHLGVYMDVSDGADQLLLDADARAAAVEAILSEVSGTDFYDGVTIDFEGLRGEAVRAAFCRFLQDLSEGLGQLDKTLYVAVQPVLPDGVYFDGFDYRTIGELADRVILMAHDYQPAELDAYVGTEWQRNAALTPIEQVYYALKAAVDPETGVQDPGKLVLAVSFATQAWQVDAEGRLLDGRPVSVSIGRVAEVLAGGAEAGYSQRYRNPYLVYQADDGDRLFLWYEDARSIGEKMALARLFGVSGVSVWRLGTIPDTASYDVTGVLLPE